MIGRRISGAARLIRSSNRYRHFKTDALWWNFLPADAGLPPLCMQSRSLGWLVRAS